MDDADEEFVVRGTLAEEGGRGILRIAIEVEGSLDDVRAALTEPERLEVRYGGSVDAERFRQVLRPRWEALAG